ncbi:MAG: F0F1 ATP synthase subunit gamma [Acidimicrobiia bacterium]
MAGGQERILKRRIKSIQSTKKITRAMELIAASRIKKAEDKVRSATPYANALTEAVKDLVAAGGATDSPLLKPREQVSRVAHIAVGADRGLCGGYNYGVTRATEGEVKHQKSIGRDYTLYTVGRKVEGYFRYRDYKISQSFTGFSERPSYADAEKIASEITRAYIAGEIDEAHIIYTRFITSGSQEVVVRPVLPLDSDIAEGGDARPEIKGDSIPASYTFEPSPSAILESILPLYVEARVYAALLNAAASELAARQRAMKSATDNAEELIVNLSRVANRLRQDAITTEIMEVVGGAEALRGGHKTAPEMLLVEEENLVAALPITGSEG